MVRLRNHPLAPLLRPLLLLTGMFVVGTCGFMILGRGEYSLLDCIYMTAISLTTVGYADTLDVSKTTAGRIYTIVLLVVGMGVTLYSVSAMTAFVVEGHLRRLFRERAMQKRIDALSDHYILCGAGETGGHVFHELVAAEENFVVIEQSSEVLERISKESPKELLYVVGDATRESVLEQAGIQRAKGLVAALTGDKDNLFLVVSACFVKPGLRVVAKCIDYRSMAKFKRAGADHVVSPTFIGGLRIASELLRPNVVSFFDNMLRGRDKSILVDEVEVPENAFAIGKSLKELRIGERTGMLVIAVRDPGSELFDYNPGGERTLFAGSLLVVIGRSTESQQLAALLRNGD